MSTIDSGHCEALHEQAEEAVLGRRREAGDLRACLIRQVKRFSPLKSWAVRLAGRRGFRKAAVATAQKIAVLMLTLWKLETEYQWTKEATA